jgi:hypothetical protein
LGVEWNSRRSRIERLLWREYLVEGASGVGVEVVLHQVDPLGVCVALFHQIAQALHVVLLGAMLRHRDMTPASQRFHHDEEIGRPVPRVLTVTPLGMPLWPRNGWLALAQLGMQHDGFLVQADRGVPGAI